MRVVVALCAAVFRRLTAEQVYKVTLRVAGLDRGRNRGRNIRGQAPVMHHACAAAARCVYRRAAAKHCCGAAGGDALASDLMWREIRRTADKKPLVATMGDVAASGGYYMGMAAPDLLAHPLTITGSIGVITGKFNLEGLYEKARPPCH